MIRICFKHDEDDVLLSSSENSPSMPLDQSEVIFPECELLSKPSCEGRKYLKYGDGANFVERDVQVDACVIDQIHNYKDFPFSKDQSAPKDFLKAKQKLDTKDDINEAKIERHTMTRMKKVLHDQNYVFDRGKNLCSFRGA